MFQTNVSIKQAIDTNLHLFKVIFFCDTWGNLARKKFCLLVALVDLPSTFISCTGHGFPKSQGNLKETISHSQKLEKLLILLKSRYFMDVITQDYIK